MRTVTFPEVTGYRLDDGDPKRVLLTMSNCGYITGARLFEETAESVTVEVIATGPITGPCTILHPVRLKDPLGDREVVDSNTGEIVPPEETAP